MLCFFSFISYSCSHFFSHYPSLARSYPRLSRQVLSSSFVRSYPPLSSGLILPFRARSYSPLSRQVLFPSLSPGLILLSLTRSYSLSRQVVFTITRRSLGGSSATEAASQNVAGISIAAQDPRLKAVSSRHERERERERQALREYNYTT